MEGLIPGQMAHLQDISLTNHFKENTHNQVRFHFARFLVGVWHQAAHKVGLAIVKLEWMDGHFKQTWNGL